jgi:hypothetical protein
MEFRAPWGKPLRWATLLTVGLLLVILVVGLVTQRGTDRLVMVGLPLAVFLGAALFTIRGYAVSGDALLVRRLFWNTRLQLHDLRSVEADPQAMAGSWRVFGNGGLFSFSGLFRNRRLGTYHAYVTDLERAVVLRFVKRVAVVTPEHPQRFVDALRGHIRRDTR